MYNEHASQYIKVLEMPGIEHYYTLDSTGSQDTINHSC